MTGRISFYFTKQIEFPDDIQNLLQQQISAERRQLSAQVQMINVMAGVGDPGDDFDESEDQVPELLASWDLISINKEGLSI